MRLSELIRPSHRCPRWIVDEIKEIEADRDALKADRDALKADRDRLQAECLRLNKAMASNSLKNRRAAGDSLRQKRDILWNERKRCIDLILHGECASNANFREALAEWVRDGRHVDVDTGRVM